MSLTFDDEQIRVAHNVQAIARKDTDPDGFQNIPVLLHLATTFHESSWRESIINPNDPGTSKGPYQINKDAHPDAWYIADNPWYDYGFWDQRDEWIRAFTTMGGYVYWENVGRMQRIGFLQSFAPKAQGSDQWTLQMAIDAYDAAVQMLELIN